MKTVEIEIHGVTPLLIHRFTEKAEQPGTVRGATVIRDPREEAKQAAYIADDGTYYFSAFSVPRAMANAGANYKMKGTRKTLRFVVPSTVRPLSDAITILDPRTGLPVSYFEVDARPVTIPATKGRVMRYRPRWNEWAAKFDLAVTDEVLPLSDVQKLLTDAGASIGIGDFRPERSGPFGTFRVVSFKEKT